MASTQKKNISITVELDEDQVPEDILWEASDADQDDAHCRALILSLWDHQRKDTLRLDLWTRKMTMDEMMIFFHQTLVSMADTLEHATKDEKITGDMRDFCNYFAERMEIAE